VAGARSKTQAIAIGEEEAAAKRLEIPLPTAERSDEVTERAEALGYKHRDLAALFRALEQMANDDCARKH